MVRSTCAKNIEIVDWFGGHLSSQDRVLILCVCILDMSISIITDMHVDNQIRDGHIIMFVKKNKKGEIIGAPWKKNSRIV